MRAKNMSISIRSSNARANICIRHDISICMYICTSTNISINKLMFIRVRRNISIRSSISMTINANTSTNIMNTNVNINISFTNPQFSGFRYAPSTTALQCLSSRAEGWGLGLRGLGFVVWGNFVPGWSTVHSG